MKTSLFYITTADKKEARRIARLLLKKRLAACANILDDMESLYWWKGRLEKGREAILLVKTRRNLAKRVIAEVKAAHRYDCPCIVELPILSGYAPFLKWIEDETRRS
jgi:periplasmic divalent cation tolerance protein